MNGTPPSLLTWTTASILSGVILVAFFQRFNQMQRWTDRNFRGLLIPTSVGVAFGASSAALVPQALMWRCLRNCAGVNLTEQFHVPLLFVSCVTMFTILGLLDDRCGTHEIRGLRGHFTALAKGRITTGAVKALGGALTALIIAALLEHYRHRPLPHSPLLPFVAVTVDALLIALAANAINLLDRRPSRALKGYALGLALALALGGGSHVWLVIPVTAAAIAYAPLDFRGKAMMGDAGSNTLGAALGLLWALDVSLLWKAIMVALLLLFNVLSERISYTEVIESNRVLSWFDRLGVKDMNVGEAG